VKRAEKLFERALRLHADDKLEEASATLDAAVELNPNDITHVTAREYIRQQRVSRYMNRGNELMNRGQRVEAAAEFRAALELDATNAFAAQRYQDASGVRYVENPRTLAPVTFDMEPDLTPRAQKQSFDFRGNSRSLIEQVATAYGMSVVFDDSVAARQLRFQLADVDFETAMRAVRKITHTFFIPMSPTQILVANDTPDVRRRMERMSLRTFYVPEAATPQDLQDLLNTLRTMLDIRFVNGNAANSTLTVRAPKQVLDAAGRLIQELGAGRPEVLLDVYAYQFSQTKARQIGVDLPLQFTAFHLGTEARALANQPGIQNLIDQLTRGGQLNAADAAALAGVLAAQQGSNSPLLQPFATFGGGLTFSGLVIPPATANLNFNESVVKILQHATLRAQQGRPANFHVGDRFPVLTSAYSTVITVPRPTPVQDALLQPLTPSFTYEDLGISLKATPLVSRTSDVNLQFELEIRSLSGASFNTVPTISNRQYTGTITVKDGEASVIAGAISETEQKSLRGLPWLSSIPGLKYAVSTTSTERTENQILLVIVPRVVRPSRDSSQSQETYLDGS
jgi:type II secretory pathway component GspD/PulD (secretin)